MRDKLKIRVGVGILAVIIMLIVVGITEHNYSVYCFAGEVQGPICPLKNSYQIASMIFPVGIGFIITGLKSIPIATKLRVTAITVFCFASLLLLVTSGIEIYSRHAPPNLNEFFATSIGISFRGSFFLIGLGSLCIWLDHLKINRWKYLQTITVVGVFCSIILFFI